MTTKTVVQLFLQNGRVELLVPYPVPEAESKLRTPDQDGYIRLKSTDEDNTEAIALFKDKDVVGFLTFPMPQIKRPANSRLVQ